MELGIFQIKKKALASLKGNWGKGVLLTFLIFLITTISPVLSDIVISGGFMNWLEQEQTPIAADFFNIFLSLMFIPLSVASYWFYLVIARQDEPKVAKVFSVYTDLGRVAKLIGTSLLLFIFTALWSLLLIIPGIIKGISYSQAYFLLKDHPEYSAFEAITESKHRMKGYKWKLFLLNLSFIGWAFLAIFTLGIGFLWLSPYISTANATFYNELIAPQDNQHTKNEDMAI